MKIKGIFFGIVAAVISSCMIGRAACPTSDLTGDCRVDIADFGVLAGQWLASSDMAELSKLAEQWLAVGLPSPQMTWVAINDTGAGMEDGDGNPISEGGFVGEMSRYETTNLQYCQYLNEALAAGAITVVNSWVYASDDTGLARPYCACYDYNTWPNYTPIIYENDSFMLVSDDIDRSEHPVVMVSWYGAKAFADFYGWQLPTQWQWQATADYDGSFNYGYGEYFDGSSANFFGGYYNPLGLYNEPYTSPVGYFGDFGYGLSDISGNVWEWTDSVEDESAIVRGGSWNNSVAGCTVSESYSFDLNFPNKLTGFRVCRIELVGDSAIEDFETGDFDEFAWQHAGDANWTIVTGQQVYEGEFSARSGAIAEDQSSVLKLTVEVESSEISFYSKVSSEECCDYLSFAIDDTEVGSWGGEQDWALHTYAITPGIHTLTWSYIKDGSVNAGDDCAWVDLVSPLKEHVEVVPNINWVQMYDSGDGMKDWQGNDIDHGGFVGEMSKYEVTNAQYCIYLNSALAGGEIVVVNDVVYNASDISNTGRYFVTAQGDSYSQIGFDGEVFSVVDRYADFNMVSMADFPVIMVSWYGAKAFAEYYGWQLPTEWQWQAVADYDGSYTYGCGMSLSHELANHDNPGFYDPIGFSMEPFTTPVGYYGEYGYGISDFAGNVWEWTESLAPSGDNMIIRGGSWHPSDSSCNVTLRYAQIPYVCDYKTGFRVCREQAVDTVERN